MKKINLKIKAGVLLVVWLMICVNNVLSGTVTNDDINTTTTDSSLEINYSDGWIRCDNATIDNNSIDNSVINTWLGELIYNNSDASGVTNELMDTWNASAPSHTLIVNSNNNSWSATAANLQTAIDGLNNQSGWVELPVCNITLTTTLKLGDGCWLRGAGNASVLWLDDNANCTMIQNYDTTNGNPDIRISDLRLEGNGLNQAEGIPAPDIPDSYANGITIKKCGNFIIKNCYINNTVGLGICAINSNDFYIKNNNIQNIGTPFVGTGKLANHVCGIETDSCIRGIIESNFINNVYSCGITIETYSGSYRSSFITVKGNIICDAEYGIYNERCENITSEGNIVFNIKKTEAYAGGHNGGIRYGSTVGELAVDNSSITDNCIYDVGTTSTSTGIFVSGYNNIVSNNVVKDITGYGIYCGAGRNLIVDGNLINSTSNTMIIVTQYDSIINNNIMRSSPSYGIAISPTVNTLNKCTSVSGNSIFDTDGIVVTSYWVSITGNSIYNSDLYGVYLDTGQNCTVTGNIINTCPVADGIKLNTGSCNNTITSNIITNAVDTGIEVNGANNNIISFNRIIKCGDGIEEQGTSDWNIYIGNNVKQCTAETIDIDGANCVNSSNIGTIT